MTEPRRIYLGTVTLDEPGEVLALNIPADLDADAIKAVLERANAERVEAAVRESAKLREIFLEDCSLGTFPNEERR
jgi:hypothetical protein